MFGGLLTELGWRWTFLLPVPVALALLIAAPRVLAKDGPIAPGVRRSFDFAGAVTLTAGMLLLVRTIVEAPDNGWGVAGDARRARARRGAAGAPSSASSAAPPTRSSGSASCAPRRCCGRTSAMMTMFGAYIGFQFVGTLYLQSVLGWSPLETALAFLPGGLLVAFGSPRLGPLVDRFGTGRIIAAGSLAFLVGYALFLRIGDSFSYVGLFLPTMLLIGVGFGLSFPAFNMQATAGIADHEQGLASGPRQHVAPGRRRDRSGDLDRGDQRQQRRRHAGRGPDGRVPAGDRRRHGHRGDRPGGRPHRRAPAARAPA